MVKFVVVPTFAPFGRFKGFIKEQFVGTLAGVGDSPINTHIAHRLRLYMPVKAIGILQVTDPMDEQHTHLLFPLWCKTLLCGFASKDIG